MPDDLCPLGFAPHSVRPTRCKRCFRDYSEHKKNTKKETEVETKVKVPDKKPTVQPVVSKSQVKSAEETTGEVKGATEKAETPTNGAVRRRRPKPEDAPTEESQPQTTANGARRRLRQRPGSWSYFGNESAVDREEPERKSVLPEESSEESTSADVQFMLQVKHERLKGRSEEDTVSVAGTETTETTLVYQDSVEDLQNQVATLSKQLAEQQSSSKSSTELAKLNENLKKLKQKVFELETANEELKDEKHVLQLENKELQEEMDKRPAPTAVQQKLLELQQKLQASEAMCEELVEENEEYKKEIQGLEDEMNEIQDNFSEDQVAQYMDIKKELEQTAKNCRVLQFKLKKTERRCAQMESEKTVAEEQLRVLTKNDAGEVDKVKKIQQLEAEIKVSKEVTMKLTTEMDALHAKLRKSESDRETLLKKPPGHQMTVNDQANVRPHSPSDDTSQLMRELYDTVEREKDIREQLKYSEEEARTLRKRLSNLEDDNEGLLLQIKKMAASPKGRRTKDNNSGTNEDEESVADFKLQMELLEQEAKVLRKKLSESQSENETLSKELKFMECQLSEKSKSVDTVRSVPSPSLSKKNQSDIELNYNEQRMKLLEVDCNELRRKLIDKERENEQLSNDLETANRRRGGAKLGAPAMQRSRSLDSDSQQVDLKRQLQLMEQEVSVLRQKANDSEKESERLSEENRRMQLKMESNGSAVKKGTTTVAGGKLKEKINQLETEVGNKNKRIKELEEENVSLKKLKVGKEEVNSSTISQFKSQIEKLEANLKTANSLSEQMKKDLERIKTEKETKVTEVETEKRNLQKELGSVSTKLSAEIEKLNRAEDEISTLKKKLTTAERNSSNADKKRDEQNQTAIQNLNRKLEQMEKDLDDERERFKVIKKRLDNGELIEFEQMRKVEQEKHKLQKESLENEKKVSELSRRIQDVEQAAKDGNKVQRNLKRELEDTQKELENEKSKTKKLENKQNESSLLWIKEKEELKKELSEAQKQVLSTEEKLQDEKNRFKLRVESLEDEILKTKNEWMEKNQKKETDLKATKEQLSALRVQLADAQAEILSGAKSKSGDGEFEEKFRRLELLYKRHKNDWTEKEVNLESVIKTEVKRRERMEKDHEAELKDRDEDMLRLKDKIKKQDSELRRLNEQKGDLTGQLEENIKSLEKVVSKERQEYEDLTSKYEMLEEEYLVLKAQKVMEKEQVEGTYSALKRNHQEIEGELKALRETFNVRQDTWIKEKLDLQEKVKELSTKLSRANVSVWELEKARLKETIEEKQNLLEQAKKEDKALKEEVDKLKRQVDDTKKMLDDYNRLKSYGKNIDTRVDSHLLKEVEDLRNKIQTNEKQHRSELSSLKMKSEQRMVILQDEIHALHLQNAKYRREKDAFKEMLEGAQKSLADLKSDSVIKERSSHVYAQLDDAKQKLEALRKEKEEVLDRLDIAERNCSKAKTEYMTEKASWEIKMATMQTKINELEETTILQGGKSKIFGVKTKLELAWQKEREEQHRLLTESHKMARELKQRLLDIEAARDRERLESVRHLDQLRANMDEQQTQQQAKMNEIQNELKELRDAHAKLAATHERMRRHKDRLEWEKEEMQLVSAQTKQLHVQDKITIANLSDELRNLKSLVPKAIGEGWDETKGGQPQQIDAQFKDNFKTSIKKISTAVDELRKLHGEKDEDKIKRNLSFRRAISEDEDESSPGGPAAANTPLGRWRNPQRVTNYPLSPPSMLISPPKRPLSTYRKTLSLEMDTSLEEVSQGSNSSLAKIGDNVPVPSPRTRRRQRAPVQQSSVESDISNTSLESLETAGVSSSSEIGQVQSVVSEGGGRMRGFREKMKKKLTKTKSIEGTPTAGHIRQAGFQVLRPGLGGGSASSVASELSDQESGGGRRGSKDLKSRISKLFHKSSRSSSRERVDNPSENGKKDGKSQTLDRPLMVNPNTKTGTGKVGSLTRYGSTGHINK